MDHDKDVSSYKGRVKLDGRFLTLSTSFAVSHRIPGEIQPLDEDTSSHLSGH